MDPEPDEFFFLLDFPYYLTHIIIWLHQDSTIDGKAVGAAKARHGSAQYESNMPALIGQNAA